MAKYELAENQYIGHEVYFPDQNVPKEFYKRMKSYGFTLTSDGDTFYIADTELELFRSLAHPYEVKFLQYRIIFTNYTKEEMQNMFLDMLNKLNKAGVYGVENWKAKIIPMLPH